MCLFRTRFMLSLSLSHTHTHTHMHTHTYTCMFTYTHTHTFTLACMHALTHTHACMHSHTHTHTCIHTPYNMIWSPLLSTLLNVTLRLTSVWEINDSHLLRWWEPVCSDQADLSPMLEGKSSNLLRSAQFSPLSGGILLLSWCFTSTETIRFIRDG